MKVFSAILSLALFIVSAPCQAGVFSDDLARCMATSTTDADRTMLMRWIFVTLALHPDVASMVSVTTEQRNVMNKSMIKLYERLMTVTCHQQAKDTLKNEGEDAVTQSFLVLGQVSARSLMMHTAVTQGYKAMGENLREKVNKIVAE